VAYGHEFIESASQIGSNDFDENRLDSQSVAQNLVVSYNIRLYGFLPLAALLTHSIFIGRIIILELILTIAKYQS